MPITRMAARTMMPDGRWYYVGGPSITIIYNHSMGAHLHGDLSFMTDRDWCYHAECDLIIFALLFGEVVSEEPQQDSDVTMDTDEEGDDEDEDGESGDGNINSNDNKKELDDVSDWPEVLDRMERARWAFTMAELQAYWKETVVPKLRAIRETRDRRGLKDQNNTKYNALAGLAAACHTRNVDPADHPHGYDKPMPTASEIYLERICTEFGGKSAEVIREQEQALKQGQKLKKSFLQNPTAKAKFPILVALDDDPTGTQTCHDIPVLTVWDKPTLVSEFRNTRPGSGFFILTNSRALHPGPARALITEICTNLKAASAETDTPFEIVLRGDSTLRGHFPLEAEAAEEVLGEADAWLLCPFFLQGGRYTIDDVHYVAEGESLVPAAQTPFAQDATFGYKSSNLREYVVEKSKGAISSEKVTSLSLETIRVGGVEAVLEQLRGVAKGTVVIVNAAAEEDVDVVVLALLKAAGQGKRYLFRTGAAFVSARLGIEPISPISAQQLSLSGKVGGLIIAGSYVPKTTAQLEVLRIRSGDQLTSVVIDVRNLLKSDEACSSEMAKALEIAEKEIARGQDVLVMTSRELITGEDEAKSLDIGATVAKALVSFLVELTTKPRYVIAKGGITSSDMATKGLKMRKAMIVGQAAAGVPLWRCDEASAKWPGLPYVVFPGNVGSDETLFDVVKGWRVT
ncbi:hypothetical protein PG989_014075 [Apiospora arundinis]